MEKKLTEKDYHFFSWLGFLALAVGWFSFSLALAGFFERYLAVSGLVLILGFFGYFLASRKLFRGLSKEFIVFALFFAAAGAFFAFTAEPSVFSGRDQGSISEAAVRLVQNGQLEFSTPESEAFFKVYGPGKALNFPGFHYTSEGKATTQFPLVYISFLALFYSLFGLWGFKLANALLFFIFAQSLYLIFRRFSQSRYRIVFVLLIAASFAFSWFAKFTLSENMAMALLWLGILGLVRFLDEPARYSFGLALLSFGLLFFARIEGIAFSAVAVVLMIIFSRRSDFWKTSRMKTILVPASIFLLFFLANLGRDFYFYKEIAKALIAPGKGTLQGGFHIFGFLSNLAYTGKIFAIYGAISFLIAGLFGIAYFLRRKDWKILLPFFVVLPSFIYLLDPNISADHPWMLRRFSFSILPALMLYSFLFFETYLAGKKERWFPAILAAMLLLSLYPFAKFASFSENRKTLGSVQELSRNFGDNDLVLVDRLSGGNGWSMPTGPLSFLFGKRAVYFFNPNDLAKLDLRSFDKVYLVVSDQNLSFFEDSAIGPRMAAPKDYLLESSGLDTNELIRLPEKKSFQVRGKIFEITK